MTSQRKLMKVFVLIILAVFLLSSGLVSVMYFVDVNKAPTDGLTGDVISGTVLSGDIAVQ